MMSSSQMEIFWSICLYYGRDGHHSKRLALSTIRRQSPFSIPGEENAMKKYNEAPGQISAGNFPPDWIGK
jgi:hypothetical protein